jgi:uncharacterized membrane protein YeaQ/YmgE (transglycosylase-associated protein family)
MSLLEFVVMLVVAGLIGSLGQAIAGFTRGGCLVSIVLGFIGAFLGVWLARSLGLPTALVINVGGVDFPLLWSVVGAALFVAVVSLISGRRRV